MPSKNRPPKSVRKTRRKPSETTEKTETTSAENGGTRNKKNSATGSCILNCQKSDPLQCSQSQSTRTALQFIQFEQNRHCQTQQTISRKTRQPPKIKIRHFTIEGLTPSQTLSCFQVVFTLQRVFTTKHSNRVGSERLVRSLSSHTTVRTVRYTAVS